jgi:hypothetical protein
MKDNNKNKMNFANYNKITNSKIIQKFNESDKKIHNNELIISQQHNAFKSDRSHHKNRTIINTLDSPRKSQNIENLSASMSFVKSPNNEYLNKNLYRSNSTSTINELTNNN